MATSLKGAESSNDLPLERGVVAHPNAFRLMVEEDIPWALELGKRRYSNKFDFMTVEGWFRNLVLKGPLCWFPIRTDHAFLVGMLCVLPWEGGSEVSIALLCADHNAGWEPLTLLRASIDWGRRRKASVWRITSETHFDIGSLALRLGAKEQTPRYTLNLEA